MHRYWQWSYGGDRQLISNYLYNQDASKIGQAMQSIYHLKADELNADFLE